MILVYTPEGQPEQRWDIQLGRLRCQETEAIERRTGMPYGSEYKQQLLQGQVLARRALLWTLLRRTHHTLRFEDVDFADEELELQFDRGEWQRIHDEVRDNPALDDEDRAARLALIRAEIDKLDAEAAEAPAPAEEPDPAYADLAGKAPDSACATTTG
ncbi:hypothetical protein [Micromonospora thermarum]|uniref:Uncharacterized protein n=1 Tax=Micromonospora thermarum TaxID=2720024 RepID=A0ABX0ZC60_9ACTN|nr:hypothetical protein [Micromonospora thermarum]NJP33681.1 hypothetical protein [Micromonospora thermarum]